MNYLGTPYRDHIYNYMSDLYRNGKIPGELLYSREDIERMPGCELLSRLLKTTCSIEPCGKDFTQYDLLSLILLHYKYITAEQYRSLMPWAKTNLLYLYAVDAKNSKKAKANKNKAVRLRSYSADDASKFYMLTREAFENVWDKFPASYLWENRIPDTMPPVPGKHALHQIMTNNTPFRLLRDVRFSPFMWFTNVVLNTELPLKENLALHDRDRSVVANSGSRAVFSLKPDGIIVTETTGGTYYCLVEQDMDTERKARLREKHVFYGEMFEAERSCENITVLFNSARRDSDAVAVSRSSDYEKKLRYPHTYSKLKRYMAEHGLTSIADTRMQLIIDQSELSEEDYSAELGTLKNMYELICDFLDATGGLPEDLGTISDVEAFISSPEGDISYRKKQMIYERERKKERTMRRGAIEYIDSNSGRRLRDAILDKGLSYIIANRIAFDRYAPVLLAKESHYEEDLFKRLAGTSLFSYCDEYSYVRRTGAVRGFVFHNAFDFPERDIPVTVFEEISHDVGGFFRAGAFCASYKGGALMNLILLVKDDEDARSFTQQTQIGRFETLSADVPEREFKVHVAFVNYTQPAALPFIINYEGKKVEVSKNTYKRLEDVVNG